MPWWASGSAYQRMKPIPAGQACGFAALRGLSAAPLAKYRKKPWQKVFFALRF
ncbi:MAG TPA: hypothetical protein PK959_14530 [Candidatus Competibacteraceae bacterium]|nr:hypothetical protein [Candidatus Competibacteraceae bacterium]